MRPNKVKALWSEGKPAAVAWLSVADTYVAEMMAHAGFDALVLDMQHGMGIGPDRAAAWLQAVSGGDATPMVRVPWNEPAYAQWALDAGAYGVIVPLVNSRDEAAKAGLACRYPPLGYRSLGPNRVRFYAGDDYIQHANDEIICLVMVEDIRTVNRIEELAEAPGIDGFYIGPADLAQSMGIAPFQYAQDERHAEACQRVLDAARAHGLVPGVHCANAQEAVRRFQQGFRFCPAMIDVAALRAGAAAALRTVREGA
ncbi:MAG: aldolase/citrate lyase family protein [Dehalococcoidia bacterium]